MEDTILQQAQQAQQGQRGWRQHTGGDQQQAQARSWPLPACSISRRGTAGHSKGGMRHAALPTLAGRGKGREGEGREVRGRQRHALALVDGDPGQGGDL